MAPETLSLRGFSLSAAPFTGAPERPILPSARHGEKGRRVLARGDVQTVERAPETSPDRTVDLQFMVITAAIFSVILFFNALNVSHERAAAGEPVAFWEPVVWEGTSGAYFLAILPVVLAFVRRFWPLHAPVWRNIAFQLGAAVFVSLGHVVAIGALRWTIYRLVAAHYNAFGPLTDWPYELRKDLLAYGAVVTVYVMWRKLRAGTGKLAQPGEDILEVRDGARRHFVPLSEVLWVEAAGNYVELHRGTAGLLHRASLSAMAERLEGAGFVRIHRSRLVRRDAVAAIESKPTGDFVVRLRDGGELAGSRRYRRPLLAD